MRMDRIFKSKYFFTCKIVALLIVFSVSGLSVQAQISANADAVTATQYSGSVQDQIFIFCGNKGETKAKLQASTALTGTINYEWQKYNTTSGSFEFYLSQNDGGSSHSISSLEDGAYRVKISNGTETETYTAWVFNNYYEVTATITESNCEYFQLEGTFESPVFNYFDLNTGQALSVNKEIEIEWKQGNSSVSKILSPRMYDPPTKDTRYTLNVFDKLNCGEKVDVDYTSIVTKADFSISKESGEAPLDVSFTNESENGTPGKYEWFFFKEANIIKEEALKNQGKVDSIDFIAYNDELTYTYEKSGTYMVKLVAKHISELHTCTDTVYLPDPIEVDTSFVKAPNFFTPNGDGSNDQFIVKFWSVKSIKITIFNRWGKRIHQWESSNVEGFENTVNTITESVWDGRIGNQMANPGVYYYVVEARGRDDKKRWSHGFVHLFRDK